MEEPTGWRNRRSGANYNCMFADREGGADGDEDEKAGEWLFLVLFCPHAATPRCRRRVLASRLARATCHLGILGKMMPQGPSAAILVAQLAAG